MQPARRRAGTCPARRRRPDQNDPEPGQQPQDGRQHRKSHDHLEGDHPPLASAGTSANPAGRITADTAAPARVPPSETGSIRIAGGCPKANPNAAPRKGEQGVARTVVNTPLKNAPPLPPRTPTHSPPDSPGRKRHRTLQTNSSATSVTRVVMPTRNTADFGTAFPAGGVTLPDQNHQQREHCEQSASTPSV